MPTMVMSHPPKSTGKVRSKRTKKADNILPLNYMYVGTPKKKFTFYVRERLVYRSNVEVTFDDVFNYLVNIYNDESISLHYSVNNTYVPITTTGQLHTFISHVHNDPNALLYVENNDYVWNVTPQSKGHKMAKRNPGSDAADPNQEGSGDESEGETIDEENSQEEELDDEEEYDDEEESEAEDPVAAISDAIARAVVAEAEGVPIQAPRASQSSLTKVLSSAEAVNRLKTILDNAIAGGKMGDAPTLIAEHLVGDVWYSRRPGDEKIFRETVDMLKSCIGSGLIHYYKEIIAKFVTKNQGQEDRSGEGLSINVDNLGPLVQPSHDSEKLLEFVENSMTAACNMLECVQHLAQLDREFSYFDRLSEQVVKDDEKRLPENALPSHEEICERLTSAITSAHYGFQVLKPVFPANCECKPAVTMLIMELEKLLSVMKNIFLKTCSPAHILETKTMIVEKLADVMKTYKGLKCKIHDSIEAALRDAEAFKWRSDLNMGYEQWEMLNKKGEAVLTVPQTVKDTLLECPHAFASIPADIPSEDRDKHPISEMTLVADNPPMTLPLQDASIGHTVPEMAYAQDEKEPRAPPPTAVSCCSSNTVVSSTSNTSTTSGTTAGGAPARLEKQMSPELKKMIDNMYKNLGPQHNYVYPNPPKPGTIMIPTGGFARCRCSKNCPEFLMEPAYEYIERFNEPRQTVWEKTKMKRFKKN